MNLNAYYSQLVGGRITEVQLIEDSDFVDPWPTLFLTLPNGEVLKVEISRDPEGNGPGFAFIEEIAA